MKRSSNDSSAGCRRITERRDFSLPDTQCNCPPWERCEHLLPSIDAYQEVSLEDWNFLKSIE